MEYLQHDEILADRDKIENALEYLLSTGSIVGKPKARQWTFLRASLRRLFAPGEPSAFDGLSAVQAAQLKFEVEDKLRRFYLRPGESVDFVFRLVHKSALSSYAPAVAGVYPALADYCLLIRDIGHDRSIPASDDPSALRPYLERVVSEANDAEFRAYARLPEIDADDLSGWFFPESPAKKEIMNLLSRHQKKGWVICNPLNPSTKRLLDVRVKKIEPNEAVVATTEYWYLRWWDTNEVSYAYSYRETNRQTYILRKDSEGWKVLENLRAMPRTSVPYRWSRRHKR
ncbi:MAG: hypothetical protein M0Z67_08720 [Nitrospiraceae bacterium]|nr:hypothetical protein [Nitrospiraceae bacterium]